MAFICRTEIQTGLHAWYVLNSDMTKPHAQDKQKKPVKIMVRQSQHMLLSSTASC